MAEGSIRAANGSVQVPTVTPEEAYSMEPWEVVRRLLPLAGAERLRVASWKRFWPKGVGPRRFGYPEDSPSVLPLVARGLRLGEFGEGRVGIDASGATWVYVDVPKFGLRVRVRACLAGPEPGEPCPLFHRCMVAQSVTGLADTVIAYPLVALDAARLVAYLALLATGRVRIIDLPVQDPDGTIRWAYAGRNGEQRLPCKRVASVFARDALRGVPEWEELRAAALAELPKLLSEGVIRVSARPLLWPADPTKMPGSERAQQEELLFAVEVYDPEALGNYVENFSKGYIAGVAAKDGSRLPTSFVPKLAPRRGNTVLFSGWSIGVAARATGWMLPAVGFGLPAALIEGADWCKGEGPPGRYEIWLFNMMG